MMMESEKIYESIKYFSKISDKTYQLLGWLGYTREKTFQTPVGKWEIYTKRNFKFPYFINHLSAPINKFVAILIGEKEMVVYGSFEESIEEIEKDIVILTQTFFIPPRKILGMPLVLTEENAQDYGYIRGILIGVFFIFLDLGYSWIFKLRNGIITGFIDYIKLVYWGNPPLGIGIGIAATGLYFGVLLILIPILTGNIYVKMAKKVQQKRLEKMPESFKNYEFGIHAERNLAEEFSTIVEEKKKESIYSEIKKIYSGIDKNDFEFLYMEIRKGLLSPEAIYEFLENYRKIIGEKIPIKKFLEIIIKYEKASFQTEIKLTP